MTPTPIVEAEAVKFRILNKIKIDDGESGFITTWVDGPEFDATLRIDTSTEAQIARAQGLITGITFFTKKAVALGYDEKIRRVSDGKTFRVTSEPHKTPTKAKLDLQTVTAEPWDLPASEV